MRWLYEALVITHHKKLGAGQALASETDDEALETALRNAQKNGIQLDTLVVTEYHRYEKNTLDDWCALLLRRP